MERKADQHQRASCQSRKRVRKGELQRGADGQGDENDTASDEQDEERDVAG